MRPTLVLSGVFALAAAADSTSSPPATSVSMSPAQQSQDACINACSAGDVDCQAHCIAVPSPNASQANATTECVADCPQGDGSASGTQVFQTCVQQCISAHYFVTSQGTPDATGSADNANSGSASATGSAASGTGATPTSSASGTKSSNNSSTKTGSSSASTSTNAAPAMILSGSALVGVFAALLAF